MSSAGVGVILTTPIVFEHTTYGYANFLFAAILAMGSVQLARAIHDNEVERGIAAGLLVGLAAWTRPEGGAFGLAIVGAAGGMVLVMRARARVLVGTTIAFLAVWGIWLSFGARHQSSDEVGTVLRALTGRLPVEGVKWEVVRAYLEYITARLLVPATWGVLLGAGAALTIGGLWASRLPGMPASGSRSKAICMLASVLALLCLAMVGLGYYHYESSVMLADTFDRAFLPAAILLWTAVIAWAAPRLEAGAGEIEHGTRLA
jgi:hypothetical protein